MSIRSRLRTRFRRPRTPLPDLTAAATLDPTRRGSRRHPNRVVVSQEISSAEPVGFSFATLTALPSLPSGTPGGVTGSSIVNVPWAAGPPRNAASTARTFHVYVPGARPVSHQLVTALMFPGSGRRCHLPRDK